MNSLVAVIVPFALAALMLLPGALRGAACRLAPLASLALLPVLIAPDTMELGLHLVGLRLGPDVVSMPLLWLTFLAWSLAGWLAAGQVTRRRAWFWCGWLCALGGMNLLLLAGNLAGFYLGYATLSLSAYLLVTHAAKPEAWRAGRVYMVMALAGEAAILAGILLLAGRLGNVAFTELLTVPATEVLAGSKARWLLLAGFAVKLGILPLHLWLPLAHPVAPVPASAILSGVIVKAGLLGWLRMVPALGGDPAIVGSLLLGFGLLTTFGGVALGLTQTRVKTVLAYSTISQMGLVLCGFSIWFLQPEMCGPVTAMLGLLALHHGLNKAALFLACACQPGASRWRLTLFALPAISLAGAPLTTGFLAKDVLKQGVEAAGLGNWVMLLLALTSTATALLMWRAFGLARLMTTPGHVAHPAWVVLVLAAVIAPWVHGTSLGVASWPGVGKLLDTSWPLLLAFALIALSRRVLASVRIELPEGDVVVLFERLGVRLSHLLRAISAMRLPVGWVRIPISPTKPLLARFEAAEAHLPFVGLAFLAVAVILWVLTGLGA